MFDIGWGELLVIGIVTLIVIGPKELPGLLRTLGQWTGKLRQMASEFQSQFNEALREAELEELRKQAEKLGDAATSLSNPVEKLGEEVRAAIEQPGEAAKPAEPTPPPEPVRLYEERDPSDTPPAEIPKAENYVAAGEAAAAVDPVKPPIDPGPVVSPENPPAPVQPAEKKSA